MCVCGRMPTRSACDTCAGRPVAAKSCEGGNEFFGNGRGLLLSLVDSLDSLVVMGDVRGKVWRRFVLPGADMGCGPAGSLPYISVVSRATAAPGESKHRRVGV